MTPAELFSSDLAETALSLRANEQPFAFATIVRTAGTTAAKPGAKAIIGADGTILHGFLGGGCTRGAVRRATLEALETGAPKLVSVAPEDFLNDIGVSAGAMMEGVLYARNGCPSRGTIDIFIEPCLPMPELTILGNSPVAEALAQIAPHFHWSITRALDGKSALGKMSAVVVATQGQGDLDALRDALAYDANYVAFVGSKKKFAALSKKLSEAGVPEITLATVSAPAGLDIGAVTPEEIALSILAELVTVRRNSAERDPNA
ncbi:XdhC /CoxI family-like protein [Ruegeria sp. HKCCD4884]|uniref:XdhC family protein n=1 Tax=Ruegeria sp. HKCCD4884 TaxID=2683022 RepID=UPI001491C3E8|nr:XdhC family protein [Ruegeria sp. HKCCD4884]NOD94877.1 XdhC /CoxI family-like protein [Ruegeria sp. HKCCD4884]